MKKYFEILNIIFITLAIFWGVKAAYKILTAKLDYMYLPRSSGKQVSLPKAETVQPLNHYRSIAERNLFKTKEIIKKEPEKKEEEKEKPLKLTDMKLKLWGTVTGNGTDAYAVIQEERKKKQNLYMVGDSIQDATLKKILREKVILNVNGNDEILKIEKRAGTRKTAFRPQPAQRPNVQAGNQKVRLSRSAVEDAVSNINNLMKQAKIRPHFRNGKPDGLVLTRVRQNSFFTKMGLRNGDVIMGVDGEKITSVDDALKLYDNLRSSPNMTIQIKRRGRVQEINYDIM